MASKKYAYYNHGNKIGLVQQDTTDATSTDYGKYKSPTESIDKGLQIEYSYSPFYTIPEIAGNINTFGIVAWTSVDGYLTFLASSVDWTDAPQSTAVSVGDYIYSSSAKWRGVHKVQELQDYNGSHGGLKTFTKVSETLQSYTVPDALWLGTSKMLSASGGVPDNLQNSLNPTDHPYLWMSGSDAMATGNGLFTNWYHNTDSNQLEFNRNLLGKYFGHSSTSQTLDPPGITPVFLNDGPHPAYLREARKDFSYIVCGADVMSDEAFDINLNRYQVQAVVFYLKAKYLEESGDIERYEYYMKKFRETIRRFSSARSHGPYVQQGFWGMR